MSSYYTNSLDATTKAAQDSARAALLGKPLVQAARDAAIAAQNDAATAAAAATAAQAAAEAAASAAAGGGAFIAYDTDGTPYLI